MKRVLKGKRNGPEGSLEWYNKAIFKQLISLLTVWSLVGDDGFPL